MPQVRRMATELSLVSEKSSPGGGAMTHSITPPGEAAYRWYSWVRGYAEEGRCGARTQGAACCLRPGFPRTRLLLKWVSRSHRFSR